jgi:hypothetical protein
MGDLNTDKVIRAKSTQSLSRRRFVRATGGLAVVTVAFGAFTEGDSNDNGGYRASSRDTALKRAPRALSARERAMILQVAKVGAVYPIAFPEFGEAGLAVQRVTAGRLAAAERRLPAPRMALVRKGAQQLLNAGLVDADRTELVNGLGRRVLHARSPQPPRPLIAVVALAIATVSRHFDPNADDAARMWLDFTGNLVRAERRKEAERH